MELDDVEADLILRAGARAPSYYNLQPWRCTVRGAAIYVAVDPARVPTYDARGATARIAVGAFLEAARTGAEALGLRARVELDVDGPALGALHVVARGAPQDGQDPGDARETNRAMPESPPLDDDERDGLVRDYAAAVDGLGIDVVIVSDDFARARIGAALGQGGAALAATRALHEEAMGALRFTRAEARATRDGIDVGTLAVSDEAIVHLAAARTQHVFDEAARSASVGGARAAFASSAAAVCLVARAPVADAAVLRAGVALQRVWCATQARGFAVQPWTAATILSLQDPAHLARLLAHDEVERVARAAAELRAALGAPADVVPVFALRVHRSGRAAARALRRPPRRFVEGGVGADGAQASAAPRRADTAADAGPSPPSAGGADALLVLRSPDVKGWRDETGRPLGEQGAPEEARAGVVTEHRKCPYPGVRREHERPMNVTALKQMGDHWADMLGGLSWFRALAARRFGAVDGAASYELAWRSGQLGSLLASWLRFRRGGDAAPAPVLAALQYKVLIGVNGVVHALHFEEQIAALAGEPDAAPPVTAARVLEEAEERAVLIGPREVCAGPPAMILQALDALLTGAPQATEAAAGAQLAALVDDEDAFVRYASAHMSFAIAKFLHTASTHALANDLTAWAAVPGALDGHPRRDDLVARIAQQQRRADDERIGLLVADLDDESRGVLCDHFAALMTGLAPEGVAFGDVWRAVPDDVLTQAHALGGGGPGGGALVAAAARAFAVERAMLAAVEAIEREMRAALQVDPVFAALDERASPALVPIDLRVLACDLLDVDARIDAQRVRLIARG